jgi:hypothetical protein
VTIASREGTVVLLEDLIAEAEKRARSIVEEKNPELEDKPKGKSPGKSRLGALKYSLIIMGAAGRDFHNFNVFFRDNPDYHVVAFTATQIPNIEGRKYPAELAGAQYPEGVPIYPESDLEQLIREHQVDQVVLPTAMCRIST